jgi:hypothetical protein
MKPAGTKDWKCGKCGKEYTNEEYLNLKRVKMVEDDPDPWRNYGFTSVCECGYVFHKDKWQKVTKLSFKYYPSLFHRFINLLTFGLVCKPVEIKIRVSTVFLELNHGFGGRNLWYETMIFDEGSSIILHDLGAWRYETKEEAEEGHEKIVGLLREGKFKLKPHEEEYEIILKCEKTG